MTDDEYLKQGEKALETNIALANAIIDTFPDSLRAAVRNMMDGPLGEQFVMAPASTRKEFHYAFPCGLLAHSLSVVKNAVKIAEALAPGRYPRWKVMFVALFHDLGKAGTVGNPYYQQVTEAWKRERGEYYNISKEEWMPTSEKSIFILQQHGIDLDHETYLAIRLSDGAGPVENKPYDFRTPLLALIVHWADHFTTIMEKEELA